MAIVAMIIDMDQVVDISHIKLDIVVIVQQDIASIHMVINIHTTISKAVILKLVMQGTTDIVKLHIKVINTIQQATKGIIIIQGEGPDADGINQLLQIMVIVQVRVVRVVVLVLDVIKEQHAITEQGVD